MWLPLGMSWWINDLMDDKVRRIWILQSCRKSSAHAMKGLSPGSLSSAGGRGPPHSCGADPGSSLVSVCQRSTFLPLFFRQSIQCCRVSPWEWHPKDTPPSQCRDGEESQCDWRGKSTFNKHRVMISLVVRSRVSLKPVKCRSCSSCSSFDAK